MTTASSVADQVAAFEAALRAVATPERAAGERKYLKFGPEKAFLGATVPVIRRVAGAWARAHKGLGHADLAALTEALWATDVHELRSLAILLLERYEQRLGAADMPLLARMLREAGTWALVDGLAEKVVGALAARDDDAFAVTERWATDPDFWIRRSSLLALLGPLRAGTGDFAVFARRATPMLGEKEFFIRKAIGWVLRETTKKRPDVVYEYLKAHRSEVSGLSMREGARSLPAPMRIALLGK